MSHDEQRGPDAWAPRDGHSHEVGGGGHAWPEVVPTPSRGAFWALIALAVGIFFLFTAVLRFIPDHPPLPTFAFFLLLEYLGPIRLWRRWWRQGNQWLGVGLFMDDTGITIGSRTPKRATMFERNSPQSLHYHVPWSSIYDAALLTDPSDLPRSYEWSWTTIVDYKSLALVPKHSPFVVHADMPVLAFRVDLRTATVPPLAPPHFLANVWGVPVPDVDAVTAEFARRGVPLRRVDHHWQLPQPCDEAILPEFFSAWLADPFTLEDPHPHVHRSFSGPHPTNLAEYEAACRFEHGDTTLYTEEAPQWERERRRRRRASLTDVSPSKMLRDEWELRALDKKRWAEQGARRDTRNYLFGPPRERTPATTQGHEPGGARSAEAAGAPVGEVVRRGVVHHHPFRLGLCWIGALVGTAVGSGLVHTFAPDIARWQAAIGIGVVFFALPLRALWRLARDVRRWRGVGRRIDEQGITLGDVSSSTPTAQPCERPQKGRFFVPWQGVYDAVILTDVDEARRLGDGHWGQPGDTRRTRPTPTYSPFFVGARQPTLMFRVDMRQARFPDLPRRFLPSHAWAVPLRDADVDGVRRAFAARGLAIRDTDDRFDGASPRVEAIDPEYFREWLKRPTMIDDSPVTVRRDLTGLQPQTLAEYEAACFLDHGDRTLYTRDAVLRSEADHAARVLSGASGATGVSRMRQLLSSGRALSTDLRDARDARTRRLRGES